MRLIAFVILAVAATCAPAEAAWKQYLNHPLGFAVDFPAPPKVMKGSYKAAVAGTRPTTVYTVTDDNIVYTATVIDFQDRAAEGANLLEEASFIAAENNKVLMMDFGRVQPDTKAVYGRRMTVQLPKDGGRKSAAFYFTKGKLYELEAVVLPANGDYGSPDAGRFVDSVIFDLNDIEPGSPEMPPLK